MLGNNVLAQVPDLNDFVGGVKALLGEGGTATFEFPHLATLDRASEYDTIYHEHFSYFSLFSIREIFGSQGLARRRRRGDPDSWRLVCGSSSRTPRRVARCRPPSKRSSSAKTQRASATSGRTARFTEGVEMSKRALLDVLIDARDAGSQVVGYGAPGKGNTLLNYCGIRTDLLDTRSTGTRTSRASTRPAPRSRSIAPEAIAETRPDLILILPWNLAAEISAQLAYTAEWGAELVVPIPSGEFAPGAVPSEGASGEGRHLLRRARRAHGGGDANASPSR